MSLFALADLIFIEAPGLSADDTVGPGPRAAHTPGPARPGLCRALAASGASGGAVIGQHPPSAQFTRL